jgi:hypothetical protein
MLIVGYLDMNHPSLFMVENERCGTIKAMDHHRGLSIHQNPLPRCLFQRALHLRQFGQNSLAIFSSYRRHCDRRFLLLDTGLFLCNNKSGEMGHGTAKIAATDLAGEYFAATLDREYFIGPSLGNRRFPLVASEVPAVDPIRKLICDLLS